MWTCVVYPPAAAAAAGHVLHVLGGADADEHAARLPAHHHRRARRPPVQLLSPLVRRHLPRERAHQYHVHLPGAQTVCGAGRRGAQSVVRYGDGGAARGRFPNCDC